MTHERRQQIERLIAKKTIAAFVSRGYTVSVWDGEDWAIKLSSDRQAILAAMFSTDCDRLVIRDPRTVIEGRAQRLGSIDFVYGNDGFDVIADHTAWHDEDKMNDNERLFMKLMEEINDYASTFDR